MTYNASNTKDIREAEKRVRREETARRDFIIAAMTTIPGRAFFYDLVASCSPFAEAPTFSPNHDYFTAGQRSVGLRLTADIVTNCPDQYITMIREANVRSATDAAIAERSRGADARRDVEGRIEPADPTDPDTGSDTPDLFDPYTPGEP